MVEKYADIVGSRMKLYVMKLYVYMYVCMYVCMYPVGGVGLRAKSQAASSLTGSRQNEAVLQAHAPVPSFGI